MRSIAFMLGVKAAAYELQDKPDKQATLDNGSTVTPRATLKDEYGGVSHIIEDDHCAVLINGSEGRAFKMSNHWYPEAAHALGQIHGAMFRKQAGLEEELAQTGEELGAAEFGGMTPDVAQRWNVLSPIIDAIARGQGVSMGEYGASIGERPSSIIPGLEAQGITLDPAERSRIMQSYVPAGKTFDFDPSKVYSGAPTWWQRIMGYK